MLLFENFIAHRVLCCLNLLFIYMYYLRKGRNMLNKVTRWRKNKFLRMVTTITFVFASAALVRFCYAGEGKDFEATISAIPETKRFLELMKHDGVNYDKKVKEQLGGEKGAAIFVPTDAAFAEFDKSDPEKSTNPGKDEGKIRKLKRILKNHVILGKKEGLSIDAFRKNGADGKLETASGDTTQVTSDTAIKNDKVTARIQAKHEFSHGYLYIIDKVLAP